MDRFERMMGRARALWRDQVKGRVIYDHGWPLEGLEQEPVEAHHIAGRRYGDVTLPVPVPIHRELTRRQMEEHPSPGPDPTNPLEVQGRYFLGLADILEWFVDALRFCGERYLAAAKSGHTSLTE